MRMNLLSILSRSCGLCSLRITVRVQYDILLKCSVNRVKLGDNSSDWFLAHCKTSGIYEIALIRFPRMQLKLRLYIREVHASWKMTWLSIEPVKPVSKLMHQPSPTVRLNSVSKIVPHISEISISFHPVR